MSDISKFRKPGAQHPSQGLNQLLDQLGSEGSLHSEGQFTLSLENALEKLQQFQLKDPHFYVLNLVSAATLKKAGKFSIVLGRSQDVITFDGELYSREQLESIFSSDDPATDELAVALTGVKALGYETVLFESAGGLEWSGKVPEFLSGTLPFNRLTLHKKVQKVKPPQWLDPWSFRSESALKASCQLAPMEIWFNHRRINNDTLQIVAPAMVAENRRYRLPSVRKVGRGSVDITLLSSNGRFSAIVGAGEKEWSFVFRGITYTRTSEQLNTPGLGGIIVSDGFKKDISHTDLVENDHFQHIVDSLQELLTVYVTKHLTLQALNSHEARKWLEVAALVGKSLQQSGEKREAARVDAWTYGHRAKMKLLSRAHCRNLVDRYDQPLVFLLDFFYWSLLDSVEENLEMISSGAGHGDDKALLPWMKGAQTRSLLMLFQSLLPALPHKISWETVRPVAERLALLLPSDSFRQEILVPLKEKLDNVVRCLDDLRPCRMAAFLHAHGMLIFEVWLELALETGLVAPLSNARGWLLSSEHKEVAQAILERLDADKKQRELMLADQAFESFMLARETPMTLLTKIESHLKNALSLTEEDERSELLALLCLVGFKPNEDPDPAPSAWQIHRAALVWGCRDQFLKAQKLHLVAHERLQGHWFSHLLVGDVALALRQWQKAHEHYEVCLKLRPTSSSAREAVAETSPLEDRREQWLGLARSLSATKLVSYYAYREAFELPLVKQEFSSWVKLRALTSYAEHVAGDIPRFDGYNELALALNTPAVVRALVREERRAGRNSLASQRLARLRLIHQLSLSVPLKLRWKEEYLDSEQTFVQESPERLDVDNLPSTTGPRQERRRYPTKFEPLR